MAELIEGFDEYVDVYDRTVPFQRVGQLELHSATVARRRELGSVAAALHDEDFIESLRKVLLAWGVGRRGSRLAPAAEFAAILRDHRQELVELDGRSVEASASEASELTARVWHVVEHLPIVDNRAKIVACTKALHHLVPDLVVPMDRAWTGAFFRWTVADPQYRQPQTFAVTYGHYLEVARAVSPSRYVGPGWRTSATKVLDNAVIGYCKAHGIGPGGSP